MDAMNSCEPLDFPKDWRSQEVCVERAAGFRARSSVPHAFKSVVGTSAWCFFLLEFHRLPLSMTLGEALDDERVIPAQVAVV